MSNSVSRSYSKNNPDTSLREETLCPCPPETAKPALVAVDGGIPFLEFHVDPDVPFCPSCELVQFDLNVLYACQCDEVW